MSDIRNSSSLFSHDNLGAVCIDTKRVLDACRDRDCYENVRVYLTAEGEDVLDAATNIRARSANIICAYVGVDDVPFNCGFFRISIRYYVLLDFEACLGLGRSQTFAGVVVLEKEVILYGGEGSVNTFSSSPDRGFCSACEAGSIGTTAPVAIVEAVEPIVLGTRVVDCGCPCSAGEYIEIPENVSESVGGTLRISTDGPRLYISLGTFSVIRLVRSAQLIVQATDYSVPDKECTSADNDDSPCSIFNNISFPEKRFRGSECNTAERNSGRGKGGCGCGK